MGQYWMLLNVDKRERSGHLGKLGEFWGSGSACNVFYRLLVPSEPLPPRVFSPPATLGDVSSNATATTADGSDASAIASAAQSDSSDAYLSEEEDDIALHEQDRVPRRRNRDGPPTPAPTPLIIGGWAGDRIVCIGDYADTGGLPSNLLTPTELASLQTSDSVLYHHALSEFTQVSGFPSRVVKAEASVAYPKDKTWVLRNLTKKVYIDLQTFEAKNIGGVDQILLTNICWSSDGDSTLEYDITGGKWAGDRFDVNVIESVQRETENEGEGENQWKDVTQQVIKSVGRIWRSQC
ncbi:hypothetical protein BDN72DRAFT_849640 [Pluteus cervinus]|uniref:Uncharacterized protein n=1 Tax=Pluteus cervinus TaxID=181527 RepID=A0ACD3A6Z3_9AGAR|nr:hypothetical protein BDN72DRAFT_849640 [Pluteus cervinus]